MSHSKSQNMMCVTENISIKLNTFLPVEDFTHDLFVGEVARIHRSTIQKVLNGSDNHDGGVASLEPDILEGDIKREALL